MDSSYDNSVWPQDGDRGGLGTGSSRGSVGSGTIRGDVNSGMGRGDVNPEIVRGDINSGVIRGNVDSGAGLDVNASAANNSNINVGADIRANVAGNHGVDFSANLNNNANVGNGGLGNGGLGNGGFGNGNGVNVNANANNNGFGSRNNTNANNNGFGNRNNANNIVFGNENNTSVSVNKANDSVNNTNVSVNNDGFSDEDSQVQGDSFYTDFKQSVDALSANDGDIILGGKKKKKWLVFGIIGGIVAVVGIMALVLAIVLTSGPKTGVGIKAKNYEEAFNIYANYFLFGERSKQAVNWDATIEDGFESYFRKVVDKPFEIEAIKTGEKTVGGEIAIMDADYEVFQGMFMKLEDRPDEMTSMVEDYGKKIKFLDKYYNVGVPTEATVLEKYVNEGYDAAEDFIWEKANAYKDVGILYDNDVVDLVGRYGDNRLSIIEAYNLAGCLVAGEFDFDCTVVKKNEQITEYSNKSIEQLKKISSIQYNSFVVAINDVFDFRDAVDDLISKTNRAKKE